MKDARVTISFADFVHFINAPRTLRLEQIALGKTGYGEAPKVSDLAPVQPVPSANTAIAPNGSYASRLRESLVQVLRHAASRQVETMRSTRLVQTALKSCGMRLTKKNERHAGQVLTRLAADGRVSRLYKGTYSTKLPGEAASSPMKTSAKKHGKK